MKTARNMKSSCNGWNEKLGPVEGFMFDLDGTLVLTDRSLRGYKVLPGAVEVLTELQSRGIPFVALTNGSAHAASEQAPKLRAAGLPVADAVLLTPTSVAADLMPRRGVKRALVLGTPGVAQPLADVGIETLFPGQEGAENVQAVYIGWHPDCNMKDIEAPSTPSGMARSSTWLPTCPSLRRHMVGPWVIRTRLPLRCER